MRKTKKELARQEFECATWRHANKQEHSYRPVLYDAGPLGYCLLTWSSINIGWIDGHWINTWFDKAKVLPGWPFKTKL